MVRCLKRRMKNRPAVNAGANAWPGHERKEMNEEEDEEEEEKKKGGSKVRKTDEERRRGSCGKEN